MFIVRSPSGVIRIIVRPVGAPPVQRRRVEGDAGALHVVAVDLAELVAGDLADEGGSAPERGDAGGGIAGAASRRLDRRGHLAVEPLRLLIVDQAHRALHQRVPDKEVLLGTGDHVDNGVADSEDVETGFGHEAPLSSGRTEGRGVAGRPARRNGTIPGRCP